MIFSRASKLAPRSKQAVAIAAAALIVLGLFGSLELTQLGYMAPTMLQQPALPPLDMEWMSNTTLWNVMLGEEHKLKEDEGVIFLKTHKTGSTTLESIFWRNLCIPSYDKGGNMAKQGKNCFLPPKDHPGKTWDFASKKDWDMLHNKAGNSISGKSEGRPPYDVWLSHAKFHWSLNGVLVPKAQRVISIVRHPAARFRSAWNWYEHEKSTSLTLEGFVTLAEKGEAPQLRYRTGLDSVMEELSGHDGFSYAHSTRNRRRDKELRAQAEAVVERVKSGKLLLLVTDRFEESLLVLAKLMGWSSYQQLSYMPMKKRDGHRAPPLIQPGLNFTISPDEVARDNLDRRLVALQPYDMYMYRLANRVLDNLLTATFLKPEGNEGLTRPLNNLKEANKDLMKTCGGEDNAEVGSWRGQPCACFTRDNNEFVKQQWASLDPRTDSEGVRGLLCGMRGGPEWAGLESHKSIFDKSAV